jgi:hypothetical protein
VFALLEHSGNFVDATKALAAEGYGSSPAVAQQWWTADFGLHGSVRLVFFFELIGCSIA